MLWGHIYIINPHEKNMKEQVVLGLRHIKCIVFVVLLLINIYIFKYNIIVRLSYSGTLLEIIHGMKRCFCINILHAFPKNSGPTQWKIEVILEKYLLPGYGSLFIIMRCDPAKDKQ